MLGARPLPSDDCGHPPPLQRGGAPSPTRQASFPVTPRARTEPPTDGHGASACRCKRKRRRRSTCSRMRTDGHGATARGCGRRRRQRRAGCGWRWLLTDSDGGGCSRSLRAEVHLERWHYSDTRPPSLPCGHCSAERACSAVWGTAPREHLSALRPICVWRMWVKPPVQFGPVLITMTIYN